MERQPIETAPKYGNEILLADFSGNKNVQIVAHWAVNAWVCKSITVTWILEEFKPTHWMPLLEPPKEQP